MFTSVARFALVAFLASHVSGTTWSDDSKWEVSRYDILLIVNIEEYGKVAGAMATIAEWESAAELERKTCEEAIVLINKQVSKPLQVLEKSVKELHGPVEEARYVIELETAKLIEDMDAECNLIHVHPSVFDKRE